MSTSTNGARQPQFSLDDFHQAAKRVEATLVHLPDTGEVRLHPHDIEELKRAALPITGYGSHDVAFRGIRIIPDMDAPRLRRKEPA
jgi:hypothetical protein